MSIQDTEILETKGNVNVRFVIDEHGEGWYCNESESPALKGCEREGEFSYDRGFGG